MKVKLSTVDCGLSTKKGIALLMMLIMISSLMGVIMLCSFVLSHEVNKDERHQITRQRMLDVKRALIGRLADVGGGEDIISCGGFINDYGEPYDDLTEFDITELLSKQSPPWASSPAEDWVYDGAYLFWAGYRGERYLEANAQDASGTPIFIDGWGNIMEISFSDNQIEIKSLGKDGIDNGSTQPKDYRRDIPESFYWRRDVQVKITNTSANDIKVRLIFPDKGLVKPTPEPEEEITAGSSKTVIFNDISVGLRKIEILEGSTVKETKILCLSSGNGTYTMKPIDYSG